MSAITINNLGKYIRPTADINNDIDEQTGCSSITFEWDYTNEKLDNMAEKEYFYRITDNKKNLMWIEELKRIANWREGEYIYAYTTVSTDSCYFKVSYKKDKVNFDKYNIIVEKNGYVCMKARNLYSNNADEDIKCDGIFIRVISVYNDKIKQKRNKNKIYIL
jgi:hypothetical protein